MKHLNNIRIILTPVDKSDRKILELIENEKFSSKKALAKHLDLELGESVAKILNVSEFQTTLAFTNASNSFRIALQNARKRKQCYKLTDFMDDFNNQEFGKDTDKYWMGYVRLK